MSYLEQREREEATARARAKDERLRAKQFEGDLRAIMKQPAMRRVLSQFLAHTGIDASPFNTNGMAMGRSVGLQDAGRWWLDRIREACPEQEVVMRNEARAEPAPEPDGDGE